MMPDVDMSIQVESPLSEEEITYICARVLEHEGVTRPCCVSVSTVTDNDIRDLNRQWRGIDRPTDVISLECERPNDPNLSEGEPCELGDIVLAPSYIARQAVGYGTTHADECRLLLVHGMLHLLGYDHMEDEEAVAMEEKEDLILSSMATDGRLSGVVLTRHEGEVKR